MATWLKFVLAIVLIPVVGTIIFQGAGYRSAASNDEKRQPTKNVALEIAGKGAAALRESTREPKSFTLDSAIVMPGMTAVCYEYRAKNRFGGVDFYQAVFSMDKKKFTTSEMDGFSTAWGRECAGKKGTEYVRTIRFIYL